MKRTNAKELLPIIKAFADGEQIQFFNDGVWVDSEYPNFNAEPYLYRIKSEPKYRPFKSVEECWDEMQKHKPFGWLKSKLLTQIYSINLISENTDFDHLFNTYTFADSTPYGIKEE